VTEVLIWVEKIKNEKVMKNSLEIRKQDRNKCSVFLMKAVINEISQGSVPGPFSLSHIHKQSGKDNEASCEPVC